MNKYYYYIAFLFLTLVLFFVLSKDKQILKPVNPFNKDSVLLEIKKSENDIKKLEDSLKNRKTDTVIIKEVKTIQQRNNEKRDSIIELSIDDKIKFLTDQLN